MRILSAAMQNLLNTDSISGLSTFWKVTRQDGVIFGFTDWTQNVIVAGVTYQASSGYSRSALQQRVDLAVPNVDITGILSSANITDADIRAGRYDNATVQIWMAIATDTNFATYGTIPLPGAFIGEIKIQDGVYVAEIRGLAYALQQSFIELYSPSCQADFCDSRCKLNAASFTDNGYVTGVIDAHRTFTFQTYTDIRAGSPTGYNFGQLTWTSGQNDGLIVEIINHVNNGTGLQMSTAFPTAYPIQPGDQFGALLGCPKTVNACLYFNNLVNYRGFPQIPGLNVLVDYGEAEP